MIGLKRGTVRLVSHDPGWAALYAEESELLISTFGDVILAIEHVGSTAIPGIPAKPIIDIDIGVESLDVAQAMKDRFSRIGYEHRPYVPGKSFGDMAEQELYVRGSEESRTHYVHVTVYGSDYWNRALLFRDYLRQNACRAQEYAALKTRLAQENPEDRSAYTRGKGDFISETLEIAGKSEE
jgi:GrpB-like predicted nucleotidyltransferase (UPF0157 family)